MSGGGRGCWMSRRSRGGGAGTGDNHDPARAQTRPSKHDQVAPELRARVDEALERAAVPLPSDTDHP